jgi:hypothetical protein
MMVNSATNAAIIEHIEKMTKYIDGDLIEEYRNGISFMYNIGFLSLAQWAELYNKFAD